MQIIPIKMIIFLPIGHINAGHYVLLRIVKILLIIYTEKTGKHYKYIYPEITNYRLFEEC